jgi:hypothetical protein
MNEQVTDERKLDELELIRAYQTVFETDAGQKVLEHLRDRHFASRNTWNQDAMKMSFNEGRRAVLLMIESILERDLEQERSRLIEHMEENNAGKPYDPDWRLTE